MSVGGGWLVFTSLNALRAGNPKQAPPRSIDRGRLVITTLRSRTHLRALRSYNAAAGSQYHVYDNFLIPALNPYQLM